MLETTIDTHAQKLERLLDINQEISATLDLQELLQSIVEAAAELTDSEQASIAQFFAADESLRFIAARWMDPDIMAHTRIPLGGSIAGRAFQEQTPIIIQDAKKENFYRQVDKKSGFETRSLLAVPMMMHGQATGVLTALNSQNKEGFTDKDIAVLNTLASQAAIAIHNSQLLQESQEAYDHLAELDEMKSNFIAIASHELRVPLGLILGHASYLREDSKGQELKQVEVIERNAVRLKEIVDDLSQVESLQTNQASLRPSRVDATALIKALAKRYKNRADDENIEFAQSLPDQPLYFEGESEKIKIAVNHLIKNAFDFTGDSGRVELKLKDEGELIIIELTDTGMGIAEKDMERIFDRFHQVENHMTRSHGGLGLGLTVAKMMVEMHRGEILVTSTLGKGSQFTIQLPKEIDKTLLN